MRTGYRVSLRVLMLAILVFGVSVAALRNASAAWAGALLLFTMGLLGAAVLGVVYRREARRAWWLGFGVFGWGYVTLTLSPWSSRGFDPMNDALHALYVRLSPSQVVALESFAAATKAELGQVIDSDPPAETRPPARGSETVVAIGTLDPWAFRRIGHCLLAVLAGVVGGFVAHWFYATCEPKQPAR
jgi:hypothetical protein